MSTNRGEIIDRNGVPLAVSVPANSLFIDPLKWQPGQAELLKDLLPAPVIQDLSRERSGRFRWVSRKMDPDTVMKIMSAELEGLHAIKEQKRIYPHGPLLAHALGYCDIDDLGLAGTEQFWNRELYSPPSLTVIGRDGTGNPVNLFGLPGLSGTRTVGKVELTIDARIQHVLEHYLQEGAENWKARWGAAVCLDPQSGNILGMASWPSFDPNRRTTFTNARLRDNVIGRVYEPGSTFKPIIMGIALDRKAVSTGDRFYSPGFIRIADHVIQNYHRKAFGWETPADILINSCNVGMSQIGIKMDVLATQGSLRQWGFGSSTGIELPGEEQGLLPAPDQWLGVVPANIAIGQGIAVTPLQLALAIGAIANGGFLLKPHVVAQAWGSGEHPVYLSQREIIREVLSRDTAHWLRQAMRDVVLKGSGTRADSPLVDMAGKTGTAQVAEKGIYAKGRFVTSFVGYWPWNAPRYLVLIAIGEPAGQDLSGGKVAAPIVRQIAESIQAMHLDQ